MGLDEGEYVVGLLTGTDALPGAAPLEEFLRALDGVAFETGRSTILVLDSSSATAIRGERLEPLLDPMTVVHSPSYVELLALVDGAAIVVTNACEVLDSASVLGVPSIAVGDFVVGRTGILARGGHIPVDQLSQLPETVIRVLGEHGAQPLPSRWDGQAARRIAEVTMAHLLASVA